MFQTITAATLQEDLAEVSRGTMNRSERRVNDTFAARKRIAQSARGSTLSTPSTMSSERNQLLHSLKRSREETALTVTTTSSTALRTGIQAMKDLLEVANTIGNAQLAAKCTSEIMKLADELFCRTVESVGEDDS